MNQEINGPLDHGTVGSLKGPALMMVKGMLMLPCNVNRALVRLEENFGQAHFVIGDVLKQLEDAPSPRDDRPKSIVAFSALVDNAVAVVEGMGRLERLADPTLLAHLVRKLPPMQKMAWGGHANFGSTLKDFSICCGFLLSGGFQFSCIESALNPIL